MDLNCDICNDTGILFEGSGDVFALAAEHDIDNIARHDVCDLYADDLEAARAVAATVPSGAWLVYLVDAGGVLPATESSHVYLRHSLTDVGSLQADLCANMPWGDFDRQPTVVMVEFVKGPT